MRKFFKQVGAVALSLALGLALLPSNVSVVWADDPPENEEEEEGVEDALSLTQITSSNYSNYGISDASTYEGYYAITSATDLQTFSDYLDYYAGGDENESLKVVLTDNITLSGSWTPLYAQYIVFDGNGKTISGLNVSVDDSAGLFESLYNSTVTNLTVSGTVTSTDGYAGGIVVYANASEIKGCTNNCIVTGAWGAGGIAATANNSTISGCTNAGAVSSSFSTAGIVGSAYETTISNCTNNATISGTSEVAGIIGFAYDSTFSSCTNTAAIAGGYEVGGIVGCCIYGTISGCTNSAAITGCEEVGGIVGYSYSITTTDCTNTGAVASGHNYVYTVTKEATATTSGTMTYCCTKYCGETTTLTIPATGSSSVFVEVSEDSDVKAAISADASAYLTAEEQAFVDAGGYACLSLCVDDRTDWYNDEDLADYKDLVVSKVGGTVANTSVYCLWITLTKEVYNASSYSSTYLEELDTPVTITITIPDSVLKDVGSASGVYSIVREHEGEIEILNTVYDASANTLTFSTDKFSTYAIVFTEGVTTSAYTTTPAVATTTTTTTTTTTPTATTTTSPSTGDSSMLFYLLILAGVAMGGILYARKKRA